MLTLNDDSLEALKERVGMDTATLLVTPDSEDRYFIGEALLTGAVLFLLNEYCKGIVKGLGVPNAGEKAGELLQNKLNEVAAKLKSMLISGSANEAEIEKARNELQPCIDTLTQQNIPDELKQLCERRIVEILVGYGGINEQAKTAATAITRMLYGHTTK
ncbi:MAG: hypothetical protein ACRER2_13980 [Methylococcales bacterium]